MSCGDRKLKRFIWPALSCPVLSCPVLSCPVVPCSVGVVFCVVVVCYDEGMTKRIMVPQTNDNSITQGAIFIDGIIRGMTEPMHYRRLINGVRYTGPLKIRKREGR